MDDSEFIQITNHRLNFITCSKVNLEDPTVLITMQRLAEIKYINLVLRWVTWIQSFYKSESFARKANENITQLIKWVFHNTHRGDGV